MTDNADIPPAGIPPDAASGVEALRRAAKELPLSSGVYRMLGEKEQVLYVGKAKQLRHRVSSYLNLAQLPLRLQRMVLQTRRLEVTLTASEAEALLLEANLIKTLKPRYNILLRDDKSFPYIHLSTGQEFARISKYRGAREGAGDYFGPFASAASVNEAIALLQKAFLLRPCADGVFKNRTRPCLQYQIKRCSAPCVNLISREQYADLVSQAKRFLRGKGREIQEALEREMQQASAAMNFEKAGQLRDRIRALNHIQQQTSFASAGMEEADVIVLARGGSAVCVQVFTYRAGGNYGGRAYFPAHAEDRGDAEVMSAFIGQFYQRQPVPKRILASVMPEDAEALCAALSLLAGGRAVEIGAPQRGERRAIIGQALRNAEEALKRHVSESARQADYLQKVAALFGLRAPPARIEVYDNSHVSGTHAVGAMIVAGAEGFDKKAYRIYNIKNAALTPGDDYAMLREVLARRFKKLPADYSPASQAAPPLPPFLPPQAGGMENPPAEGGENESVWPDLLLIDGGQGQLSAAQAALERLGVSGVPLAAISKGPDRNAGREWFHMPGREAFQLPVNDPALHYLQRLRDEAHRFAIGAHRNRRSKAARVSELDAIASIGPARKRELLRYFGSAREVGAASAEEIAKVPGISRELAGKIYAHFHGG